VERRPDLLRRGAFCLMLRSILCSC
jgi:hypothetical protein